MSPTPAMIAAGAQLLGAGTGLAGAAGLFGDNKGPDRDFWGRYWREAGIQQSRWTDITRYPITHRVEDAKRAGIHPVFALGATAPSGAGWSLPVPQSGSYSKDVVGRTRLAMQAMERMSDASVRIAEANAIKAESDAALADLNIHTKLTTPGGDVETHGLGPDWSIGPGSPQEDWEKWYGEAGNIPGAYKMFKDWMQTIQNKEWRRQQAKKRKRRLQRQPGTWRYHPGKGWFQVQ